MAGSSKISIIVIFLLASTIWAAPRLTGIAIDEWPDALRWSITGGILVAMLVLGIEEMRKDRQAEAWADDPRKSKLRNWMEKRRKRFSPRRGVEFFFLGLLGFSLVVGIDALTGEVGSIARAALFVLILSLLAGAIGMFTEKVPF